MQELLASQAAASSAHANYILARDNATRYNKLFTQGATSQLNTQQYQTQFEAALASLNQANAQLEVSQNKFNYTNLYADNDGVVAGVTGEVGQVVAAGTPTISIIQSGEQEVQIYIPENHLDKINLNQNADIDFWALKDVTATGFIREIAPMSDSVTRTYKVHVAIPTMPQDVKLGMTAKVRSEERRVGKEC